MTKRKHISWKTKCASALLNAMREHPPFPFVDYDDAKQMTEDQFLSLFQWDHNILHETGSPDVDKYWNLTPMLIKAHREKTKTDAAIIAKGRRIRQKERGIVELSREIREFARENPDRALAEAFMQGTYEGKKEANNLWTKEANRPGGALQWTTLLKAGERELKKRKIQSRGFDKTKRKKMDGTVVKR